MPTLRPGVREGQVLRALDLQDEQNWRREQNRRHLLTHHTSGIVRGLKLTIHEEELRLETGLAVDGEGYELHLTEGVVLPFTSLAESARQLTADGPVPQIDLWLLRGEEQPTDSNRTTTNTNSQQTPSRLVAHPVLRLTPAGERAPGVFLGRILPNAWKDDLQLVAPHSGVKANSIASHLTSPTSQARLHFDATDRPACHLTATDDLGQQVTRVTFSSRGHHRLAGDLEVSKDLALAAVGWGRSAPPPAAAAPWRICRTAVAEDLQELRIELAPPALGKPPTSRRLTIGHRASTGDFESVLSVAGDKSVTVAGNLILEGSLIESPIRADAADPRFAIQLTRHWHLGTEANMVQRLALRQAPLALGTSIRSTAEQTPTAPSVHHGYYVTNLGAGNLRVHLEAIDSGALEGRHTLASGHLLSPRETIVFLRTLSLPANARGTLVTTSIATGQAEDGRETQDQARLEQHLNAPGQTKGTP